MTHVPASHKFRFERVKRLIGATDLAILESSHVLVVGLGGVGSYVVEALARSGVGTLTLVDFDEVCLTNFNRQLHALEGTVGKNKGDLMAERVRAINPRCKVIVKNLFYDAQTSDEILVPSIDLVIDCIDNVTAKLHLLATSIRKEYLVVTALGSAAKLDPTQVRVVPLHKTKEDPLGKAVRKYLRQKYNLTTEEMSRITAVYSEEPLIKPIVEGEELACGINCVCPGGDNKPNSCSSKNVIHGSAVFVTGTFGLVAASAAIKKILEKKRGA